MDFNYHYIQFSFFLQLNSVLFSRQVSDDRNDVSRFKHVFVDVDVCTAMRVTKLTVICNGQVTRQREYDMV